jgi:Na+(H+)/acetate symporter ActP
VKTAHTFDNLNGLTGLPLAILTSCNLPSSTLRVQLNGFQNFGAVRGKDAGLIVRL